MKRTINKKQRVLESIYRSILLSSHRKVIELFPSDFNLLYDPKIHADNKFFVQGYEIRKFGEKYD